ncbi:DUF418 domain-containing protein [uncultured Sphingomonas sp.]|uniref:DUF418 domain-containing protein n=1 Tax=uncultured Sphingomonas sp. TaxID=158754 RepID=UPI0025ECB2DF|nr:DUF418 domain-containing protein [uncultured Sphingomonas sp.]
MTAPSRIVAIDVIRGLAVLGILVMNIVSMGMPDYAYVDPHYYGGADGANLAAWMLAYVFADGKMRALFSMLFGASLLIVTDAAEGRTPGPARTHYPRMAWLLAFGMLHAWLVWYGDILVSYALCGTIAFAARRWPPAALAYAATLLIGWSAAADLIRWHDMSVLRALATGPNPPADAVREWGKVLDVVTPRPDVIAEQLRLYRGGFADVFAVRAAMTALLQFRLMPILLPETLGLVALGMWLHRLDFWSGGWRRRHYAAMVATAGLALLCYAPLVAGILARSFDPAFLPLAESVTTMLQPIVALGYAALLILLMRAGRARWWTVRLAAAGQMALTNYLGTSLIVTTLFYGYGLGLFGRLERAELYWVVFGQWVLILAWSKPWLARFRYGPLEWLWRSLARGRIQPMRR